MPMVMPISEVFTKTEWVNLSDHLGLSPKQAEIARQLFGGSSDKQIAQELGIAVSTVRTYMSRMFVKLDVQDRNELIVNIFRQFRAGCKGCPRWQ